MKRPAAMAIAGIFFAACMGFYFWLPSAGTDTVAAHGEAGMAGTSDGLIAIGGQPVIMPGHIVKTAFGCQSRSSLDRITKQLRQHALAEASKMLNSDIDSGDCVLLDEGEHVDVAATKTGVARIRRQGESKDYWTLGEVVSL